MAGDRKIQFDLTIEERQGLRALGKLAEATDDFSGKASRNFSIANLGLSSFVGNLTSNLVQNALSGLANGFKTALTGAGDFSKSLGAVNTILPQTEKLASESIDILRSFSQQFGTEDAAQVKSFYDVVAAGVEGTQNQLSLLFTANKAAIAGLTDIKDATSILSSAFNVYSQRGETAQTISDKLFAAAKVGQTNFQELSQSLGQVLAIAKESGISFTDLAGTIGFLTQSGFQTGQAIIALRSALGNVIKPGEETSKIAKQLGINFGSAAIKAQGFETFIKGVTQAAKGNQEALARLFPDINGLQAVMAIAGDKAGRYSDALRTVAASTGDTDRAFAILSQSLGFKLTQLESIFKNFQTRILGNFEPQLIKLADLAINFLTSFNPYPIIAGFAQLGEIFVYIGSRVELLISSIANLDSILISMFTRFSAGMKIFSKDSQAALNAIADQFSNKVNSDVSDSIATIMQEVKEKALQLSSDFKSITFSPTVKPTIDTSSTSEDASLAASKAGKDYASIIGGMLSEFTTFDLGFASMIKGETEMANEEMIVFLSSVKKFSDQVKSTLMAGVANGAGQAFAAFGAAVAKGENPLDAFIQSLLSSLGDMAIQTGTMFILQGLGYQLAGMPNGPALMAAGAALAAFGGAMKVFFPGKGAKDSGGVSSGVGATGNANEPMAQNQNFQERERTTVNLTVMGDIFDSDQTALRISNLLEENFDRGILVRSGAR